MVENQSESNNGKSNQIMKQIRIENQLEYRSWAPGENLEKAVRLLQKLLNKPVKQSQSGESRHGLRQISKLEQM